MKKITLLMAAIMTASMAMADIVVEKLWESTADIPTVADAKQGVGYDGVFYIQDKTNSKIYAYTKNDETVTRSDYATSDTGQGLAIDEAGNLICRVGYFATGTPNALKIYKKGETTAKSITFTLPNPGRCDFNSASGDIFSSEGGYVWFMCSGKTVLQYVKITNGAVTAEDITVGTMGDDVSVAFTSVSHVLKGTATSWIGQTRSNDFYSWDGSVLSAATPNGAKKSTLGGCAFTIGEKEIYAYNSGTTNYNSEFKVRNMTDGEDLATGLMIGDGTATNTAYANWLTASKIDDKSYYLHQVCPGVGIALYKVYDNTPEPQIKRIYCKMEYDWWKADGAAVGAYMWDANEVCKTAFPGDRMTAVEGAADTWYVDVDVAVYTNLIFTRVKGSEDVADWGAKTADLTIPADEKNLYTITSSTAVWGAPGCTGEWSVYTSGVGTSLAETSVLNIRALDNRIIVPAAEGQLIEVFNVMGQKMYSSRAVASETEIALPAHQIYIVRVGAQVAKIKL